MKLKYQFVIREIMGEYAIIPSAEGALAMSGMVVTNAVGACLWSALLEHTTREALVERLLGEFEVDRPTAEADVDEFLTELEKLELLIE